MAQAEDLRGELEAREYHRSDDEGDGGERDQRQPQPAGDRQHATQKA